MRKLLVICAGMLILMFSCAKKTDEQRAASAAKAYYDDLLAGEYASYVDGFVGTDSLPPHYREQLIVNAKQFAIGQKEEHDGIDQVKILNATKDSATQVVNVFLALSFADSVTEEIVVPMVKSGEEWKMK